MFNISPQSRFVDFSKIAYIFGGNNSGLTYSTIQKYTGSARTTESSSLPYQMSRLSATSLNNLIFIFGDYSSQTKICRFSGGTCVLDAYENGLPATYDTCAATLSGYCYIFGGGGYTNGKIQSYNGLNRVLTAYTLADAGLGSSCAASTNILIFGGDYQNYIQRFTGTSRTTDGSSLSASVSWNCAEYFSSNFYIFGGNASDTDFFASIQKYTGSSRTTESASLADDMGAASCNNMDTTIKIFGGKDSGYLSYIQSYDGTTRSTDSATLAAQLGHHASSTLNIRNYS